MILEKLIGVSEKANIIVEIFGVILSTVVAVATKIQEFKEN